LLTAVVLGAWPAGFEGGLVGFYAVFLMVVDWGCWAVRFTPTAHSDFVEGMGSATEKNQQ
jgi:hypothetical protein